MRFKTPMFYLYLFAYKNQGILIKGMTIQEYRSKFIEKLGSVYDRVEAESFFYLMLENKMKLKRVDLVLKPDLALSEEQITEWDFILDQLLHEVPIQYLLGCTHFFGLDFEVDSSVLIPRPETEELVDWILKVLREGDKTDLKILDIGTGSGCIAITLAHQMPELFVSAIDVSAEALGTAARNAKNHGVSINFIQSNILTATDLLQDFDCIVSNPPYVRLLEKAEIRKNVLDHEPHLALFVDDEDPLLFYRKIAALALIHLRENGLLFFEINQYMGDETLALLVEMGFENVVLKKDIYGNFRMICASKPSAIRTEVLQ